MALPEMSHPQLREVVVDPLRTYLRHLVATGRGIDAADVPMLVIIADVIERELHRRPQMKRAPVKHARVTKKMAAEVWAYYRANPTLSNTELGTPFNIDGGRVSEILAGFRS